MFFTQHNIPSLLLNLRNRHMMDLRRQQLLALRMSTGFKRSLPPMYNIGGEEEGEGSETPPEDDDGYITCEFSFL